MRLARVVFASLLLLGCAESRSPTELDRGRLLHELTREEWIAFCRWKRDYGGESLHCADGRVEDHPYDQCVENYRAPPPISTFDPACPTTLGEFMDCTAAFIDDCRAGVMRPETDVLCTRDCDGLPRGDAGP